MPGHQEAAGELISLLFEPIKIILFKIVPESDPGRRGAEAAELDLFLMEDQMADFMSKSETKPVLFTWVLLNIFIDTNAAEVSC